jgi:hypothetical protein
MGLDMYLEVRKYVSTSDWVQENGDYVKKENPEGISLLEVAGLATLVSEDSYGATVSATAIYWRKVNAIHKWFVDTCAKGVDECQPIYVSRERLLALRDQVEMVVRSKNDAVAKEYLPTESGFFFGSTEYDEYYWSDLDYTLKELNRVLTDTEGESVDFIYQASW